MSGNDNPTVLVPKYSKNEILDIRVGDHREAVMITGRHWDLIHCPEQWIYEVLQLNGHIDWITEASLAYKAEQ